MSSLILRWAWFWVALSEQYAATSGLTIHVPTATYSVVYLARLTTDILMLALSSYESEENDQSTSQFQVRDVERDPLLMLYLASRLQILCLLNPLFEDRSEWLTEAGMIDNLAATSKAYLSDWRRQHIDYLVVCYSHYTLTVDLNDSVPHPHTASLCYTPSQQTAYLQQTITICKSRIPCGHVITGAGNLRAIRSWEKEAEWEIKACCMPSMHCIGKRIPNNSSCPEGCRIYGQAARRPGAQGASSIPQLPRQLPQTQHTELVTAP